MQRRGECPERLLGVLAALVSLLLAGCGGGASGSAGGLNFDPAEPTPTRIRSSDGRIEVVAQPTAFTEKVKLTLADRSQQDSAVPGGANRSLRFALQLSGTRIPAADPDEGEDGEDGEEPPPAEEPAPLQPAAPLEVTVTGLSGFRPGASVPLYQFNNASQLYEQSGASAIFEADGTTAKFTLELFGRYALYGLLPSELPPPSPAAPRLLAASTQVRRLAWDAPAGTDVLGVNLYRASGAGDFSKVNSEVLEAVEYVDYLAQPGAYRYQLTAVNSTGLESLPGPELASPAVDFDLLALFGTDRLQNPAGLSWDAARERLLVADPQARRVFAYAPDGTFQQEFGSYRPGTAMSAPQAVAAAADGGYVYVTDAVRAKVFVLDGALAYVSEFGGAGAGPGEFEHPRAIAVLPERVLVADDTRVQSFTPLGVYLSTVATLGGGEGQFSVPPTAMQVNAAGEIWGTDSGAGSVLVFKNDLSYKGLLELLPEDGGPLAMPSGLAEDFRQRIYISDTGHRRVAVLDGSGKFLFHFGSDGDLPVELGGSFGPAGLAYDPATGYLYVADPGNRRIAVFAS